MKQVLVFPPVQHQSGINYTREYIEEHGLPLWVYNDRHDENIKYTSYALNCGEGTHTLYAAYYGTAGCIYASLSDYVDWYQYAPIADRVEHVIYRFSYTDVINGKTIYYSTPTFDGVNNPTNVDPYVGLQEAKEAIVAIASEDDEGYIDIPVNYKNLTTSFKIQVI